MIKVKTFFRKIRSILNRCSKMFINPYNRSFHILERGEVRIKDHWFDDFFGNLFWHKIPKEIGIHGGLADVVVMLQYLKRYKKRYPFRYLRVIYLDVQEEMVDPKNFGLGLTRLEKKANGGTINPIKDFLENISFIDEKIGSDPTKAKEYWIPDEPFRRKWGDYYTPKKYSNELFKDIFSHKDIEAANNFWKENKLQDKFVIVFHFRRAADKIAKVYHLIIKDSEMKKNVQCLLLGSNSNEILPVLDLSGQINLIDNYTKGISLRILYQIVMKSNLYIGGRGGFEYFFWLANVPSINFMDEYALNQDQITFKTWMPEFWSQNKFKEVVRYETADPKDIFDRMIKPYFKEWQKTHEKQPDKN